MADIVIRKKVTLEFLGDDYKDCYLIFQALSVGEYETYQKKMRSIGEMDDKIEAEKEALKAIVGIVKDKFIEGKWLDQQVEINDLVKFDLNTLTNVINAIIGEVQSPKV